MSESQKKLLWRIIVGTLLFVTVIILDVTGVLTSLVKENSFNWVSLILYLVVYLILSYDVLWAAIVGIGHGQFLNEKFLMMIASCGALGLQEYKEGVAVMLLFQVGEFFEDYAVSKSRKSIVALMDIRPDFANLKVGKEIKTVDPTEVKVDDIIVIKPGEKIPLDGIIVKGKTILDTKAITGESLPYECEEGKEVISGSINLTSLIEVKVTKVFYDSTVSKILDLVENASFSKSKSENFITTFAKYYTPIVVGLALLTFVIGGLVTSMWFDWLYRALNFLVVSCPCALVISIPLSFFVGLGKASSKGILVKGSNYLEKFSKANVFVFDKTGTLTKGNFAVTKVYPLEQKEKILRLAAIAEHNSLHPIAKSICELTKIEDTSDYELLNVDGKGIIATNKKNKETILCGNEKLLNDNNIKYEPVDEIGTVIHVALNNEYIGYILIEDEVKENSKEFISYVNEKKYKAIMLTGDNEKIANHVASSLNIEKYYASLLPQDKVSKINEILENKNKDDCVCFIGDGINDAPVLMQSDIGISMGQIGSDAAIEASDIVLMKDDLSALKDAKKIANKTMAIVKENIVLSLTIKVAIMVISTLGFGNLWISIFGDVGVCMLAILNALRLNLK